MFWRERGDEMEQELRTLPAITQEDMAGKGNVGRPNPPGVSVAEMQRILDELSREVIVPAYNGMVEAQNANNQLFAQQGAIVARELEEKAGREEVLTTDNVREYIPTQAYHPATKVFVEQQIEAHQESDLYHITQEERQLGRLGGHIQKQEAVDRFIPAEGIDWTMTAEQPVSICSPATPGSRFVAFRGYLTIGEEGSAGWGEGLLFENGAPPALERGKSYLLEFFYHPGAGAWCVRCTGFG